jgi:hypothetical protein
MELAHTSSDQSCANCFDGTDLEKLFSRNFSSKDRPFGSANVPSIILHTTQKPEPQCLSDNISGASLQQPSKVAIVREATRPDRTKLRPRLVKATCSQCKGKKPRRSDQGPCEGCGNDNLDYSRENSEPKPKRRSRKSTSADGAESSLNSTETKDTPRQVRNACTRCQHRRSRCSGTRPACTSCVENQLHCFYDVAEGATRFSDLKRKLRESSGQTQALGRILAVMREGTNDQANEVFARLRMGDSLRNVLRSLPTYISRPSSGHNQAGSDRHVRTLS